MPVPRVFVSSTFYDLKYVRENLKYFIRNLGYDAILSEEGGIFYDPSLHVQDACLAEVSSCQMFLLIIGGRYGGRYKETDKSVTNAEYEEAVKANVPIFALVERSVYDQYRVYLSNKGNPDVDETKITYPSVDSTKIFNFITEVQAQSVNNALVPFSDFEDIQSYLRQQWASMMYQFLTSESQGKQVASTLSALSEVTQKVEFFTRQVLEKVGDKRTQLNTHLYEVMLEHSTAGKLLRYGLRITPARVLAKETLQDFAGEKLVVGNYTGKASYTKDSWDFGKDIYERANSNYQELRAVLLAELERAGLTLDAFLADTAQASERT